MFEQLGVEGEDLRGQALQGCTQIVSQKPFLHE